MMLLHTQVRRAPRTCTRIPWSSSGYWDREGELVSYKAFSTSGFREEDSYFETSWSRSGIPRPVAAITQVPGSWSESFPIWREPR
jgi:hypothetical protein